MDLSTRRPAVGPVRARIRVEGIVQGVGFRPFLHALAAEYGLAGFAGNDAAGVFGEVEGPPEAVAGFVEALRSRPPSLAVVDRVQVDPLPATGQAGFTLVPSRAGAVPETLVSADAATCAACLAEVLDPAGRRYRYPFTNCTDCGPRFTIVTNVPYDRAATTMAGFVMCAACTREYADPDDRRFHAQPVCCPACGPRVALLDPAGQPLVPAEPAPDAVAATARLLAAGAVVAVKGLGGYHLAADAGDEAAVAALRRRKHREDKPFAVLAADVGTAAALGAVGPAERAALTGRRRPVVLLARRADAAVAPSVAPGNRYLGVLLPYTPLHHLLARDLGRPLVLTSGNVSDEPIAYTDDDARARLARIADAFLVADRPIHTRTDDSVVRVFRGAELPVRRSRGYVPEPLRLPVAARRPLLACGAELKNTFCLAKGVHAFVSHHVGDLENAETLASFTTGVDHFRRLFAIEPRVVAYDLHPEYLSTKYALDLPDVDLVGVQHHHAHIASCLADNGATGPVIGVAFDGTGYGPDGTLWGGEILVADLAGFTRAGHLQAVPLPGGVTAIRQPWRMAAAYLRATYGDVLPDLAVNRRHEDRWDQVCQLAAKGISSPLTSSAGRLFDAVAAVLGVRDAVHYEGQAAVELEQRVDPHERGRYPMRVGDGPPLVLHGTDLLRAAVTDLRAAVPVPVIAARFHRGLAAGVAAAVARVRAETGLETVALSGGVFQNVVLLAELTGLLAADGFTVLTHTRVPPNDGGISLGQAAVAAARDA